MVGILLVGMLASCGPASGGGESEFEVIRQAADAYLSSGKADVTIPGTELWTLLTDGDKENDPNVLSVRLPVTYNIGHVCGTINIYYRALLMDIAFNLLPPNDKKLVVYSYTGQEGGGQVTALLNMLGWDAVGLQWGFTCWILCPNGAPGIFRSTVDGGIAQNYNTETTPNEPTQTYNFPAVENTNSNDPGEIIKAAADKWFRHEVPPSADYRGTQVFYREPDIEAKALFHLLHDGDPDNDPFLLDVREPEFYARGHIPGAINIPLTEVAKPDNLRRLPPYRQQDVPGETVLASIVVVSNDGMAGNQVAGILNFLGYDAVNLLWGMTGWTRDANIAPGQFEEFWPGTEKHKDILDLAFCFLHEPGYYAGTTPVSGVAQTP